MALTVHFSELAKLEIRKSGETAFNEVPGVNSYTESGGEAPTRTVTAFRGSAQRTGNPQPPTVEFGMVAAVAHPTWQTLKDAYENKETIGVRITTDEESVFTGSGSGNTAGIAATTGAVTFAAASGSSVPNTADLASGMVLRIGSTDYILNVDEDATNEVVAVTTAGAVPSAVTAAAYSIRVPSMRRSFNATVSVADRVSLAAESQAEATVTLAPTAQPGAWTIQPPA